nr:aldolase/citrate lyase family protein [uncultured Devosia sp.]
MSQQTELVLKNNVKERIQNDQVAASMVVRLVQSIEIASIARAMDFDSFYIDLEHCSFSMETTSQLCMAGLLAGVTPFVRVPGYGPEHVSRVLDGGALGVIAPHITSAEDARTVVRNAKFAPLGERSVTVGIPHLGFVSRPVDQARRAMNDATTVVAMIESRQGLENVDEIAAVEGVDILLIGTNDLCADLGIDGQFENALVDQAYETVIAACKKHGKAAGVGGLASKPQLIEKFVKAGARYVSSGSDLNFVLSAAKDKADLIRSYRDKA